VGVTATLTGSSNCPALLPASPIDRTNTPVSLNTSTRLFSISAT
jgi:hypothetical protein